MPVQAIARWAKKLLANMQAKTINRFIIFNWLKGLCFQSPVAGIQL
jgi:hypothetical protein